MVETPKKRVPYHPSHSAIKEKMINGLLVLKAQGASIENQVKAKTLFFFCVWGGLIFHKHGHKLEVPLLSIKEEKKDDTENWPSFKWDHTL